MTRFESLAELAAFLGKLDPDYASHALKLWQEGIRNPQQLADFSEPHYLDCDVPRGHIDNIKARADATGLSASFQHGQEALIAMSKAMTGIDKSLAILTAQQISTSTAVATTQQRFALRNRGVKRKHQEDENKDQANQVEDSLQSDADDDMQRVENSYHVALVKLLRQPAFYKQLGFAAHLTPLPIPACKIG